MLHYLLVAVFRFDIGELQKPVLDADGVLHVEAYAARVGVQEYVSADGVRREYRPAEEVFAPESLNTVSGAPVTIGHPGMVTPSNVRSLRVGVVEGVPARHDHMMAVRLRLDDPSTIDKVLNGTLRELSLGYRCDVDLTPGVTPDGQRFDMIQKNVKVNHCALLPAGKARAGSKAAIRLDAVDDAIPAKDEDEDKAPAKSESSDAAPGAEGSAPADAPEPESSAADKANTAVAEAVSAAADSVTEAAEAASSAASGDGQDLTALITELRSRVEQLEALLAASNARADSLDRKVLESEVSVAMPELRMDGVESAELRKTVVGKYLPNVRMDGVSVEVLDGMFQAAVSLARNAPKKSVAGGAGAGVVNSPEAARAERDARLRTVCKVSY